MKKKKKVVNTGKVAVGIGAGLAVAAAAGAAWLYGTKDGAKQRKKLEAWMLKAKGEVMEKIEKMKDVTEDEYKEVIDKVLLKYKKLKSVSTPKVVQLEKDLKKHWKNIEKQCAPKKKVIKKKPAIKKAKKK